MANMAPVGFDLSFSLFLAELLEHILKVVTKVYSFFFKWKQRSGWGWGKGLGRLEGGETVLFPIGLVLAQHIV